MALTKKLQKETNKNINLIEAYIRLDDLSERYWRLYINEIDPVKRKKYQKLADEFDELSMKVIRSYE